MEIGTGRIDVSPSIMMLLSTQLSEGWVHLGVGRGVLRRRVPRETRAEMLCGDPLARPVERLFPFWGVCMSMCVHVYMCMCMPARVCGMCTRKQGSRAHLIRLWKELSWGGHEGRRHQAGRGYWPFTCFSSRLYSSASLVTASTADDVISTAPHLLWNLHTSLGPLPPHPPGDWP